MVEKKQASIPRKLWNYIAIPGRTTINLIDKVPRYALGLGKMAFRSGSLGKTWLTPQASKAAKRAKNAYLDIEHRPLKIDDDFEYLPMFSNSNHSVYVNPEKKKFLYNIRGSANFKDLRSDIFIINDNMTYDERWFEEKNNLEKLINDFSHDGYKFDIAGHSLAGKLAIHLTGDPKIAEHIGRADAFNPGAVYNDASLKGLVDTEKLNVHLARGDILSEAYEYDNNRIGNINNYDFGSNPLTAHFMDNFQ